MPKQQPASPWHVTVLTLFPEMFPGVLGHALTGKALGAQWQLHTCNIRDFATNKHQNVDDRPFGGGAGMVLRPDVVGPAIEAQEGVARWIYLSPRGRVLNQALVDELAGCPHVGLLCGRYEGVDARVIDHYRMEEVSLGDFILSGGESAAQALIEACVRTLPGVLGNPLTLEEESFSSRFGPEEAENPAPLLEYPVYTRPALWQGRSVPDPLRSGDHEAIKTWRMQQAEAITQARRPDLWEQYVQKQHNKT